MKINIVEKHNNDFQITKNLFHDEIRCKCSKITCNFTLYADELVHGFQDMRDELNCPLFVTSGFRCEMHNKSVGGHENSYHKRGMAIDIMRPSKVPWAEFSRVARSHFDRTIEYHEENFIHCMIVFK